MLAHRDHQRAPDGAGLDEAHELGGRRHVAVLEADPRDDAGRARRASSSMSRSAVGDRRAQRLLDERVQVGGEDVGDDVDVGVVRGDDDHGVAQAAGEQVAVVVERGDAVTGRGVAGGQRSGDRCRRSAVTTAPGTARMFWMCSMPIIPVPMTP